MTLVIRILLGILMLTEACLQASAECHAWGGNPGRPNSATVPCVLQVQDMNHFTVQVGTQEPLYFVRRSPAPAEFTLTGEWASSNYECPVGLTHDETITIDQRGLSFTATKITGDECVTAGHVTFYGALVRAR